jgi:hypothetical protein
MALRAAVTENKSKNFEMTFLVRIEFGEQRGPHKNSLRASETPALSKLVLVVESTGGPRYMRKIGTKN